MIIKNGKIITWGEPNQILSGYAIKIKDGFIEELVKEQDLFIQEGEEVIDAHSQYIMPGNICAHTHFYGAFSRGLAIPGEPASNFSEILSKLWWRLDRVITEKDIELSAQVCLIDAARHGTTTLMDHHASPGCIRGSLNIIARAVKESGLRGCLCYEVTDRGGEKLADEGIQENLDFINANKKDSSGTLAALFGLHASLTLSDKTLEKCQRAVDDETGYHIHIAEGAVDEENSQQTYGKRVVERFNDFGILRPNTILAHGVFINKSEMELISQKEVWLSHQPRSNMNNAVGVAPVEEMLKMGIKVCMGNDGFSNSMWDEWKSAYLVHKLWNHDPRRMPADKVIQMGVYNNSKLASQLFKSEIGSIKKGAKADLIFVNYLPYTEVTTGNLPWHIIFGFRESMITNTLVGGRFIMRNNQLLTLDEEKISSEAMQLSANVWKKFQNINE